ncbi:Anti-sigma regulatory factor (Ser/Thr protein kinase) [Pseudobutyrivibrio sp. ACV-2]|uniref:ATP-binding protein n=1 Tax=Pseudobutyrivibrio sp. ACV-2 TaxID=1520801 RepID=UPI000897F69F|nr:ATP-binding protein [Pseudobutyrivibrio sp. ACV-2]SEA93739.1 Anti-sigma regulatory factor (Ser/Thr protein kinase) [Pseudobutyrivibrio sp. ACV-2]
MKKIELQATLENTTELLSIIEKELEEAGCSMKEQMKISVAVEEIFVNIANYAYGDSVGNAEIDIDVDNDKKSIVILFKDCGTPYNPLEHEDPDTTLSADEREIGGLGILIVKKSMDEVSYQYKDGKNILTISYTWSK